VSQSSSGKAIGGVSGSYESRGLRYIGPSGTLFTQSVQDYGHVVVGLEPGDSLGVAGGTTDVARVAVSPAHPLLVRVLEVPTRGTLGLEVTAESGAESWGAVYDLSGRRVLVLERRWTPPGVSVRMVPMENQPAGVYFIRLSQGSVTATARMVRLGP